MNTSQDFSFAYSFKIETEEKIKFRWRIKKGLWIYYGCFIKFEVAPNNAGDKSEIIVVYECWSGMIIGFLSLG